MVVDQIEIQPILPILALRMALERAAVEQILIEDRDLPIRGLPNVDTIRVRRSPSDEFEVYAINGEVLAFPVATGTRCRFTRVTSDDARIAIYAGRRNLRKREKRVAERPTSILVGGIVWERVDSDGRTRHREVVRVDRQGREVFSPIDAVRYAYRMTCTCGRYRYATPNTIHEVTRCRVCQSERNQLRQKRRGPRKSG